MSEALVTMNSQDALMRGGVGMDSGLFRARPSMLELVHKSSRQENVKFGEFRVISTNEHLGTSIRVVLLAVPQEQREWFIDPTKFTKENKGCFSLDGIRPHHRAQQPPAMFCRVCPKGDVNWEKWRKTKSPADLPPCGAYWHLLVADRATQTPYYMNVKGKSALPFKMAMSQQMSGLLAKIKANVRAENKALGYTLVRLDNGGEVFQPTPGFVVPEGKVQAPAVPLPSIFEISFDIVASSKDGGPYVMAFKNFALMKPEDKAEFGALYLELQQQKEALKNSYNEEVEAAEAVTETPASVQPQGEILPPITI
jgi:hypothetical protein